MPRLRRSLPLLALAALGGCSEPAAAPAPTSASASTPAATAPAPAPLDLPGRLIFLAEDGAGSALVGLRGADRRELLRGAGLYPAAVDPRGAALVVIAVDEQGGQHREHLEVRPLGDDGLLGAPTWTSEAATHVRNPSWGPEGRFLVFEAAFTSFRDLYRVDLPAGTLTRLTDNTEGNFEPAVSPDGRNIAFVSSRDGNAEVYRMTVDGGEPSRLTAAPLDDWGPMWAPDGQTLAFLSNRELVDRIFLMRPDGGEQRRLTADKTPVREADAPLGDEPHETDPAFAPDSAAIAYCVRTSSQGAALRLAPLDGGPVVDLGDGSVSDRSPVWSPDGAHLVFVSNRDGGDLELYAVPRRGGEPSRLTRREGADWLPRWAPR